MAYRKRHRGTTAQRGYGGDHVRRQKAELAAWAPGDPCAHCGRGIWQRWRLNARGQRVTAIHLGHNADRTGYVGLVHAYCNEADGAIRGNRIRGAAARNWEQARRW
jgi:hypothetical protein